MSTPRRSVLLSALLLLLAAGCALPDQRIPHLPAGDAIPPPPREFRAAWVATVANIDWPSARGLPAAQQRREALAILDRAVALNLNALILQVRPSCDALYPSPLEPWSVYLTGRQGRAPDPPYDPLAFWIEEAHRRGLELHAWFNPYRAAHPAAGTPLSPDHPVRRRQGMAVKLEKGYWWLLPTDPRVMDHTLAVIMDVVRRYDIDGVHLDDYFYPYPSYNPKGGFPDGRQYDAYQAAGGRLSRGDWRRDAVNRFVRRLYEEIKGERPRVKVGISPFGIWRPGRPPGIQGFDQHKELHADARLWLRRGWVDYYTPQLYWPIGRVAQSFPVLLGWWQKQNRAGRHLWPGLGTFKVTGRRPKPVREVVNEIMVTRGMVPGAPGAVHFSMKTLMENRDLARALREGPYRRPALVPASPWLDDEPPAAPILRLAGDRLEWEPAPGEEPFRWVLHLRGGKGWESHLLPGGERTRPLPAGKGWTRAALAAVDRAGKGSPPAVVGLPGPE